MRPEINEIRTVLDELVKSGPVPTQTRRRVHKAVCAKLDALEETLSGMPTPETVAPTPLPNAYDLYYAFHMRLQNEPEDCVADPTAKELAAWLYIRDSLTPYFEPKVTVEEPPRLSILRTLPEPSTPERIQTTPFPNRPASVDPNNTNAHEERMLRNFVYDHLPEHLRAASAPWCELAVLLCHTTKPGPERTVALRKLLEGKDAAVRAALTPGG